MGSVTQTNLLQPGTWGPPKGGSKDTSLDDLFGSKKVEVNISGLSAEQVRAFFFACLVVLFHHNYVGIEAGLCVAGATYSLAEFSCCSPHVVFCPGLSLGSFHDLIYCFPMRNHSVYHVILGRCV